MIKLIIGFIIGCAIGATIAVLEFHLKKFFEEINNIINNENSN